MAKFWLEPDAAVAESYNMSGSDLHELLEVAINNKGLIERIWNERFGD